MTPTEKAAGLLIVRLGNNLPPARTADEQADDVARLLGEHPVGGLILFNGRWPETRATLARLQAHSDAGLLVTTDMERGFGQQAPGATVYPHAGAFARLPDPDAEAAVREMAAQSSREALAAGVHVTYSPVADVDRNPRNPIIGARAYGPDAERAGRLVAAFVDGVHEAGQIATAKHFPGHGGTDEDSHATTPTVTDARDVLEATDLVPFRAAVAAGVDAVMTAHIAVPALDPSGLIATRSAPILRGLLRDELGFDGVVVTDSLQMAGAKEAGRTEADLAADLLAAGVDLFVDAVDPRALIEGLGRAVEDGRLDEALLDAALARVQRLRDRLTTRFGAGIFRDPSLAYSTAIVGQPEHQALAERVALGALDLARGPLPRDLGDGAGVLFVAFRRPPLPIEPPAMAFAAAVREAFPAAEVREILPAPHSSDADLDAVLALGRQSRRVALAPVIRPSAWHAFGLAEREQRLADALADAAPTTLLLLGDRRGLAGFPRADSALVAHSDVAASQRALIARLRS
ncbi:MAG TPA: glycoside hydrolase family 3 N-terminal domain-containing protein [Rubricoccaceae bacterium]